MLSEELLTRARAAQIQVTDADRQALVTRGEYHTAARRLHLAGGSLREIAQALGVSHQRVQQMVDGAGGSWWSRLWRTRNSRRAAACTFCDRPPSEVSNLIAGPNVYICDACVSAAEQLLRGSPAPDTPVVAAAAESRARCTFCRKRVSDRRRVLSGKVANVCGDCLRVCRDILDGRVA